MVRGGIMDQDQKETETENTKEGTAPLSLDEIEEVLREIRY